MECCYECPLVQMQTDQTVGDTTAAESHVIHTVRPLGFGKPVNFCTSICRQRTSLRPQFPPGPT